ncbi:DUF4399 domain-containing protein [Bradyrhizobium erythrophlei]|uniref:DUF4399 domain-containing protein n=1 Tax=Bradyrhizobium erythrophlei TaxID=1437360 RepID=UPI0035E5F6ED
MKLRFRNLDASLIAFGFAFATACAMAQSGPTLSITSPKMGEAIAGDSVTVSWEGTGVKIVPAADAKVREEGHYHLFLDREDFRSGAEIPRGMENEGIYHTAANRLELKGLKPGSHKAIVVLSYNNHVPWEPLVTATVAFTTR